MKVIERDRIVDESAINLKVWRTWAKFQPKDLELREIQKNSTHKFPVSFWPRQKSAKNGAVKERSHKRRKYTIEVFLEFFRILNKDLIMFLKPFL